MNPAALLCIYLVWLYCIPLEGAILPAWVAPHYLYWFLGAHVAGFCGVRRLSSARVLSLARPCFAVLAVSTAALLVMRTATVALFVFMGLAAAPLITTLLIGLRDTSRPVILAGAAVMGANLLALILHGLPVDAAFKLALVAVSLLVGLLHRPCMPPRMMSPEGNTRIYALLFLIFYVTGGVMHAFLAPRLEAAGYVSRAYVLGYLLAVPVGCWAVVRRSHGWAVSLAVLLGVVGCSLMAFEQTVLWKLSMFLIQAAFGVMDIEVIALALDRERNVHQVAVIMGSMILGIFLGSALSVGGETYAPLMVIVANAVLVLTLALFFQFRMRQLQRQQPAGLAADDDILDRPTFAGLSEMERTVLRQVINGCTYKQSAEAAGISESTVKTYMQRIFQKLHCHNRAELLEMISHLQY